jgi:hypothetical protein
LQPIPHFAEALSRILINRLEPESDGCGDSNCQGKPNAFFPHLDRFETTSTQNNINSPRNDTENNCANEFKIGETLWG